MQPQPMLQVRFDRYGVRFGVSRRRYPFSKPISAAFQALIPAWPEGVWVKFSKMTKQMLLAVMGAFMQLPDDQRQAAYEVAVKRGWLQASAEVLEQLRCYIVGGQASEPGQWPWCLSWGPCTCGYSVGRACMPPPVLEGWFGRLVDGAGGAMCACTGRIGTPGALLAGHLVLSCRAHCAGGALRLVQHEGKKLGGLEITGPQY